MRLLLVEDSLELANLISDSFQDKKITCITKTSALGALEFLDQHSVDVLITDLHLSHINGEELCQIAKAKYRVPTILTSGDYAVHNSKNFDAFILKPFDFSELLEMVNLVALKRNTSRPQSMR